MEKIKSSWLDLNICSANYQTKYRHDRRWPMNSLADCRQWIFLTGHSSLFHSFHIYSRCNISEANPMTTINMHRSNMRFLDLPNEILLTILKKSIERVLLAPDYHNLTEVKIFNYEEELLANYFTDKKQLTLAEFEMTQYFPLLWSCVFWKLIVPINTEKTLRIIFVYNSFEKPFTFLIRFNWSGQWWWFRQTRRISLISVEHDLCLLGSLFIERIDWTFLL